jgi:hypothetical protein
MVEPGPGEQAHRPAIEARVQTVAVEFDFLQPVGSVRRFLDKLGKLRPYPLRQSGSVGAPGPYRPRHVGSGKRLLRRRMRLWILTHPSATARREPIVSAAS